MRRILLSLLFCLAWASTAQAQGFTYTTEQFRIPSLVVYSTATSTAGCTVGVKGCIASTSFASATSISISGPDADLAMPAYPARVTIGFFDNGSNGTLACTASTMTGFDVTGQYVSENTGALSESGVTTAHAWSQITSFSATGCSGGAASDIIRISLVANEIATPVFMTSTSQIMSLCYTAIDTSAAHCLVSGATLVAGGYGINFASATWAGGLAPAVPPAAQDRVFGSVRGRRYFKRTGGAL